MTINPELLSYALKLARREKVEPPVIVPLQHWTTPDWTLIPRVDLAAPKRPTVEFLNENAG